MVNQSDETLDRVFAALAHGTRRQVLGQLQTGAATVGELAQSHNLSLPGFLKHLAVLETAGLIARAKDGRVVRCQLEAAPMQAAADWMARYEAFWTPRLDALDHFLQTQTEPEACPPTMSATMSRTTAPPTARSASSATTPSPPGASGKPGPRRRR